MLSHFRLELGMYFCYSKKKKRKRIFGRLNRVLLLITIWPLSLSLVSNPTCILEFCFRCSSHLPWKSHWSTYFIIFISGSTVQLAGILVPRPGIEPGARQWEHRVLTHWTAREFPRSTYLRNGRLSFIQPPNGFFIRKSTFIISLEKACI